MIKRISLTLTFVTLFAITIPAWADTPQVCFKASGLEDAEKAVELWTDCLDEKLDDKIRGIALFNRGRRQMDLESPEKAIEDYTAAAEFMRTDGDVYINRGHAYMELEDTKNAHSDFSRAVAMSPQDADAYANRAVVNIKLDQLEEAVYDLEKAIKNDPGHLSAMRGLATLLAMETTKEIRDGQRAVEVALRLVNLERTWENLEILAAAHAEAEQFPQAIEVQKKALELARAEDAGVRMLEENLERYERERKYK